MNISRFFIDKPIFACVLSLLIFIAGLISIWSLPISEYPEVVPPSVVVTAFYPGANPKVISETVATPLEEQINGVENMLYMRSQATSDGRLTVTVTFNIGTDPDQAQQLVQNRVAQAYSRLPIEVQQFGITTAKSSSDLTMVVHVQSNDDQYDTLYLRNYSVLNIQTQLSRIKGVGQVHIFGGGDYAMRIWLNPRKMAHLSITANDVIAAVREQNTNVAAGIIGAQPAPKGVELQLSINAKGRLESIEEFSNIIVKIDKQTNAITYLKDISNIELGSSEYSIRSLLNNKQAVAIAIFQAPGSNALELSNQVKKTMKKLKVNFPSGVDYNIVYDPTNFVRDSIKAVIITLLEAVALVVLVVILFLQTWRASIIPLFAVPISIVGTFAVMLMCGFSINALSLFGLVLAIGIVVDDAIVVVENVERNIENGLSPKDATYKAMEEVSSPIIAICLTLIAVFVPIAFVSGLTGQFYRQFALTIAISTVISAFNSLTLSPALSALLLKSHNVPQDIVTRKMDDYLGGFFKLFNSFFNATSYYYSLSVEFFIKQKKIILALYVVLIFITIILFKIVPSGYIPAQDKQYLIAIAQLPDGTTLERTDKVIRKMSEIAINQPGISNAIAFPGLSINGFVANSNAGVIFITLKSFKERKHLALNNIVGSLNMAFRQIDQGFVAVFPPPAILGLGTLGGFKLQVEDKAGLGYEKLFNAMQSIMYQSWQNPALAGVFSSYQINVPELAVEINRAKAKQMGVRITDIFHAMQVFLGSYYINDFNMFGHTYRVYASADGEFRSYASDITQLTTKNMDGEMVPLGSLLTVKDSYGPSSVTRYNAYLSADLNGGAAPGVSSGQAQDIIEEIVKKNLPKGMSFEWTDLTYQQMLAGNTMLLVLPLCVLLVFLVLAAQYESLKLPLAVILIVPMSLLFAIGGVMIANKDNNIFTQISLIVLVGLACKNAILIVEFARELQHKGYTPIKAAIEASHLRLRPILMTSLAFIMGVIPLLTSTGAGSEMRNAMGVAVFSGMVGVTLFGLFLTPIFYVVMAKLSKE